MAFFDHDYDLGPRLGARHVAPGRFRDAPRNDFLSPNHMRHEYHVSAGGGIRRSRSTGTRPAPNIQIFNNLEQDNHPRFDANANARVSPPRTPRGRVMEDEWADHRSPSRGRMFHDHHHDHHHFRFPESPDNRATQVALQDQRIRDLEERLRRENEEELLRMKYDNELLRDKREPKKAEEDRKRMIEEHEANAARQAKEEAEKKQRIIDQYHKDKKDAAEKARAAEEALKIKMEKEAKEAAEKAKQEEEEYERKRLAKIEKEKKEKAEADEKFEKEMHERLHKMGFSEEQIQAMIKGEKAKENNQVIVNVGGHRHHRHGIPTYIKIHKNHLEVATLTYFGLPWEYDRADSDYIIILKEIDHNETEVLFEHTKSLRRRTTLRIEERPRASGKPELMWVRRRGRSKSAVRNIHIKDTFF
ncbi:hypothetical protein HDK77DRAFT_178838 [Phyllosticta capitalensis]